MTMDSDRYAGLREVLVTIGSDPDVPIKYRRMAKEQAAALAAYAEWRRGTTPAGPAVDGARSAAAINQTIYEAAAEPPRDPEGE